MKYIVLVIFFVFCGCNLAEIDDCFKGTGDIISYSPSVTTFSSIHVGKGVSLELVQSDTYAVTVTTGERLVDGVDVSVVDGVLFLKDTNDCNLYRDYAVTTVRVYSPNISKIVCGTQFTIKSIGKLTYPELKLVSEDFTDPDVLAVGFVELSLDCDNLSIISNNLTSFNLKGTVNTLGVSVLAGDAVVDARLLEALSVTVFHRGTNLIKVTPVDQLKARLYGLGDLVVFGDPLQTDVQAYNLGQVVYK